MPIYHQEPENDSPELVERRPYQALGCSLLHFGPIALYCSADILDKDLGELCSEGFDVVRLATGEWGSGVDAHADLARALKFPSYYGRNLNALSDCLSGIEIADDAGLVVVLRDYDDFARRDRDMACGILDVFAHGARLLQVFGKTLLVLVQSKDPDIDFGPLGAVSAWWNAREFVRAKRCGGGPAN